MKNFLKKLYFVYFSKYGYFYNLFNYNLSKIFFAKKIKLRKKKILSEKFKSDNEMINNITDEIEEKGYYISNTKNFGLEFNIEKEIHMFNNNNFNKTSHKKFFDNLYSFIPDDNISNFSLNISFVKIVAKYLKTVPIINNIQLIKSEKTDDQEFYSSMNWHLDNHHRKLIKIIYLPYDLKFEDGPTCFLDKNTTKQILNKNSYFSAPRYFTDRELKNVMDDYKKKIISFSGKSGDILIIDTSKCLHMGSRCNKKRYQLFLTYTPIETNDLKTLNSLKKFEYLNERMMEL